MRKVALITGGSRGIGLGIARELVRAEFDVAINGTRDGREVESVLNELRSAGGDAFYIRGDVSDGNDRKRIADLTLKHFGMIHVLVNNAGIAPPERKDILDATEESFDKVLNTNLKGPYFLTQIIANRMIEKKKEHPLEFQCIINISSVSATVASVNRGEYCISKAGIAMATKLWAARLGEFDIPVYEIRPGVISTDMTAAVQEKYDRLFREGLAVQSRWGTPEDVGRAVVALSVQGLPYSTGQVIMVDGGMTIQRL